MKTITGAEFKEFYKNHWPQGCWHEDAEYEIEDDYGEFILQPDAVMDLSRLGWVHYPDDKTTRPFQEVYEEWAGLDERDVVIVLRLPKEKASEVLVLLEGIGVAPVGQETASKECSM